MKLSTFRSNILSHASKQVIGVMLRDRDRWIKIAREYVSQVKAALGDAAAQIRKGKL